MIILMNFNVISMICYIIVYIFKIEEYVYYEYRKWIIEFFFILLGCCVLIIELFDIFLVNVYVDIFFG